MQSLRNLKVFSKLLALIAISLAALLTVAYAGYYFTNAIEHNISTIYEENLLPVKWINEVRVYSWENERILLELIVTKEKSQQQALAKKIEENTKNINALQANFEAKMQSPYERQIFAQLKTDLVAYRNARNQIITLAAAGRNDEALSLYLQSKPIFNTVTDMRQQLADFNAQQAQKLKEDSMQKSSVYIRFIICLALAGSILSLLAGVYIARGITKPLAGTVCQVQEVAAGNLAIANVQYRSLDEVGQLGIAVNIMVDNLRQLVRQVLDGAEQIAASSKQLTASAEQSALAVNQVAASISDVAQDSEAQAVAVKQVLSAVEEVSKVVEHIADSARTMGETSDKTIAAARQGSKAVTQVSKQMTDIETTVAGMKQVIARLDERSNKIGDITVSIANIANQTNLLALNAAIEAARAGEQGRGFTVVAGEVSKLAEQAASASRHIAETIKEIQADTRKTVNAVGEGAYKVQQGTQVVVTANNAFDEITTLIEKMSQEVKEIGAALQHAAGNSEQVVEAVRHIDTAIKHAAAETQTVSAVTEEQSASMAEFASASQSLAKLSQALQEAVGKFKL